MLMLLTFSFFLRFPNHGDCDVWLGRTAALQPTERREGGQGEASALVQGGRGEANLYTGRSR